MTAITPAQCIRHFMRYNKARAAARDHKPPAWLSRLTRPELLLPGAFLVTMQTQLLAAFVFVDLRLAAFFQ